MCWISAAAGEATPAKSAKSLRCITGTVLAVESLAWCPSGRNFSMVAQVLYNTQFYDVIAEHQKICICFSAPCGALGGGLSWSAQVRLSRI